MQVWAERIPWGYEAVFRSLLSESLNVVSNPKSPKRRKLYPTIQKRGRVFIFYGNMTVMCHDQLLALAVPLANL